MISKDRHFYENFSGIQSAIDVFVEMEVSLARKSTAPWSSVLILILAVVVQSVIDVPRKVASMSRFGITGERLILVNTAVTDVNFFKVTNDLHMTLILLLNLTQKQLPTKGLMIVTCVQEIT